MKITLNYDPPGTESFDGADFIQLRAEKVNASINVFRDGDSNKRTIKRVLLQSASDEAESGKTFTCEFRPASPHDSLITSGHDIDASVTRSSEDEGSQRIHFESIVYLSSYNDGEEVTDRFKIEIADDGTNGVNIPFPIVVRKPEGPPPDLDE